MRAPLIRIARGVGEAQPADAAGEIRGEAQPVQARAKRIGWARLLERVFEIDIRRCPICVDERLSLSHPVHSSMQENDYAQIHEAR